MKDNGKEIPKEIIEKLKESGCIGVWDGEDYEELI